MSYMDTYHIWESVKMEDPALAAELESIKGNDKEIMERFYKSLEFGTAGLRGVLGAGTNRMNIYTVRQATQAMADYLNNANESNTVAIGYDSRINSDVFAKETACVFAANGIKVRIFSELMPVPVLSYAVRELKCEAGIVITASHNPAKYNGYKTYGPDGCQLNPDAAAVVLDYMTKTDIFTGVKHVSFEEGMEKGLIEYIPESLVQAFLDRVYSLRVNKDAHSDLHVVYSPLNGSGNRCVRSILDRMGVKTTVVPEQEKPDGNFPTCTYPNPEEKATLELGIKLCKELDADLVLATDPDCDRVGCAVKHNGEYILPTGNEAGVLMLDYICRCKKELGTFPANPVAVKSIVSSPLADEVAKYYGVEMINVLTGFKYIGEQVTILADKGEPERFLLGFEESYGYMTGDHVRDKDGVNGAMMIVEMAQYYKQKGMTLIDALEEIFSRHGIYNAQVKGYNFEGADGMEKMKNIMASLRQNPLNEIGGYKVVGYADYQTGKRTVNGVESEIGLPLSNILEYNLENNLKVIVRPSGTEPKIKVYLTIVTNDREQIPVIAQNLFAACEEHLK